jgi:hypothetical protein
LRLVLHVGADAAGMLTATLDSLDQNAKAQPVSSITFAEGVARVEFAQMSAHYDGKISADGATLEGRWKQGAADFALVFRRLASAPEFSRPQEPKKPYLYQERLVNFPGGAADVMLASTLTIPSGQGPFPAVALLGGSGPGDRDETSMGHRPFLVLADHLTRQGIAVLRFDDRGHAQSTGNFNLATHEDFAADARAAFIFLKSQAGIDAGALPSLGAQRRKGCSGRLPRKSRRHSRRSDRGPQYGGHHACVARPQSLFPTLHDRPPSGRRDDRGNDESGSSRARERLDSAMAMNNASPSTMQKRSTELIDKPKQKL